MKEDIPVKKLGVIVGVDGDISQVGMYQMSNDSEFLWYGDVLNGSKIGAFLTIVQNDIRLIATVVTEKIIDQQNTIRSTEFDNRYSNNSINRIVHIKTKGVIENKKFQITSQFVPMIGNEVTLTTLEDLKAIYGVGANNDVISIGKSILEGQTVPLSINKIFASHIGVFGNTGSGKSNTLHKLYLELFRSKYRNEILKKSQFFVIDFNGEYTSDNSFEVNPAEGKKVFNINTRTENSDKIPVTTDYLFDPDILSILFGATSATQVPFLRKALQTWNSKKFTGESISKFVVGTLKKILTSGDAASSDAKDNWINVAKQYLEKSEQDVLKILLSLEYNETYKSYKIPKGSLYINNKSEMTEEAINQLSIETIQEKLSNSFNQLDDIYKLKFHLDFQKVHQSAWKSTNIEHINPLFHRIDTALDSLKKVVEITDSINQSFSSVNIINLIQANQEITRLIPMLLSKMIYDQQKLLVAGTDVLFTKHLIIDEAHNILNVQNHSLGDSWQDYRLSVFEEIIKEGRKFGFYLTLASQRPADISPTILSQVHNYFIHRLVNDNDLRMLSNTMPTLDKSSFQKIPSLGQGEVIITGNAIQVPVFVKVDKEQKKNRPSSDDVILTDLWKK
ncbi:ATP-binding protein [Streptococcus mutans]|uniref:ATP-binding protein n=1 Tax=Streptococcus mutans TaxID=1309 RepID=UPI0028EE8FF3|nr:ATP-binding protein [Streptococcus mutans]MDT9515289.1 ATP-binding protein [Streptococcus mutans]MDT9531855.1 ATP-binding protein [Streptococcus mutans]MDW5565124.1 ATP-binding protein [Streptococcus mutans]